MSDAKAESAKGKYMALIAAFLGWMFDGLEIGLFPLAGRPALLELLDNDKAAAGQWFGYIIAMFLLGAAAGGVIFGWLGDRVGRVKAMIWSVLFYSLFSGACGFVWTVEQMAVLRFLASMGMGGEWALGVSLVMEIWPARSRPLLSGLIGAAANVGFFLVGLISLGLDKFHAFHEFLGSMLPKAWSEALLRNGQWRMLFIAGALPALLTFLIRIFVPESEKWKQASSSGPKPRVADIFAPGLGRLTLMGALLAGIALMGTWASVQWIPPWVGKLTAKPAEVAKAQMLMAVGAITFTIVVALLAEKFNRRIAFAGLCAISLIVCELLFLWQPEYGTTFLILATLANGLTAGFYGWLPLYLPELFPTRVRATGSGFCFNIGRVMAAVGAITSGQLLGFFGDSFPKMASVMSLIYLLGFVVIPFCPETKGKPLPE
jgi:SHS family sialic acid transporter-like MFS transporter